MMEYRRLGKSGLQVSALSLGSWVTFGKQVDIDKAIENMKAAYDAGVNFFDNAEGYEGGQSEIVMGKAIKQLGWRRDSFIVSSKVYFGAVKNPGPNQKGLSRKHVVEACHQALERLQLDYLDLYYCHRPDPNVPMEETVRAMTDLIQQGKVMYWGTSSWSAQQIMEAYAAARQYQLVPPVVEQPRYHMFAREQVEVEYARLYDTIGLGLTTFSPLASGLLTGKYNEGVPTDSRLNLPGYEWLRERMLGEGSEQRIEKIKQLGKLAADMGTNTARLALAWCLTNPNVSTVITGASRVEQVHDNMQAIDLLPQINDEVLKRIEGILENKPDPRPFQ
ncbi:MAG: aldo/keto reductase [Anaerolineaceae bacterium]|jgi:voltage-dependent potassium channel beta subunit|nr:aldo/keto reductase [Anaerolineaceae bacterium]